MAIDEVLLNSGRDGTATLRFYQWQAPTVSLGHFQASRGQFVPERFKGLEVVRRLSGGGAILHDRELTYSIVLPSSHPLVQTPTQIYDRLHTAIIKVLAEFGVVSRMRGDDAFEDESFLCFLRGDARDILIGSHKIVGSAQRRRQGTVLQHGSIILRQSERTPEFPGIEELSGRRINPEELTSPLGNEIAKQFHLSLIPGELTSEEHLQVESLIQKQRQEN